MQPIPSIVQDLRQTFRAGRTRPLPWRRAQIQALGRFLVQEEGPILEALVSDLGRSRHEAWTAEIGVVRSELEHALVHVADWAAPREVPVPLLLQPGHGEVVPEPRGVVGILGPWNYPFQLVLAPLVAALAAGDCVVLKPSEHAPASARVLDERLPRYLDPDTFRVVTGGPQVAQELLEQRLDLIFFTGGTETGRKVMAAAARHLTPVVLELGGKSPAIVDRTSDLALTARRIAWGKFMNAGQTCVAPDHVLVERPVAAAFRDQLVRTIRTLYGEDPSQSPDYGRIVSQAHLARLQGLLTGQSVVVGGVARAPDRYLAPTVVWDPDPSSPLMQEEIFGPVLPILPVDSVDAAIAFVADRPEPLALYLFSKDKAVFQKVRDGTRSGAMAWNDVVVHLLLPDLPFGGLGPSGMGAYHGHTGFQAFSHMRSVLSRGQRFDPALRYPPYGEWGTRVARWGL